MQCPHSVRSWGETRRADAHGPTTFAMAPWSCMREIVLTCASRKKQQSPPRSRAAMHTVETAASMP
eukprot:6776191-Prymnesium_polylepis.1